MTDSLMYAIPQGSAISYIRYTGEPF